MIDRTDPFLLRHYLAGRGVRITKSLGQHLLLDRNVLEDTLQAAAIEPGERVFEIGPGAGVLTEYLVATGADVTSCELDPYMAEIIREDFPKVHLIEGNALDELPIYAASAPYNVVANIPYNITSPLLRLLLEGSIPSPERAVLLMQKEVAERLCSPPGRRSRSYLSVLAEYVAEVSYVRTVPPTAFYPPPKVQSAVVSWKKRETLQLNAEESEKFFLFVRRLFVNPRKQLRSVASVLYKRDAQVVQEQLAVLGFGEKIRAEELGLADWIAIYQSGFGS